MNYGSTLRAARLRAGLSQAAVAVRAHTSQSAVARYETDVATPSLPTLERLLAATGSSLVIGSARPRSVQTDRLRRARAKLVEAALSRGVGDIRLFGSVARGNATRSSDIDLLVELEPGRTLIDLIGFKLDAERILGRSVDVATPRMMKPQVLRRALRDARPL